MASIQRIVSPLTKYVAYRAQVRVKGRPTESKTFTNRKDAKEWRRKQQSRTAKTNRPPNHSLDLPALSHIDAICGSAMAEETKEPPSEYQLVGPSDDGSVNDILATLNGKDSRQRLQALIGEWLRMENLVVLTAAGTLVTSGGKTMEALERAVLATIKALPDIPGTISSIIDARMAALGAEGTKPEMVFEDWLPLLTNANFIGSSPISPFSGVQRGGARIQRKTNCHGSWQR
jgi:hypothetical protein